MTFISRACDLQARNLVYMVQKRERLKKKLLQMQLEALTLEAGQPAALPQATPSSSVGEATVNTSTAQSRSSSSGTDSSSDLEVDMRQTRCVMQ